MKGVWNVVIKWPKSNILGVSNNFFFIGLKRKSPERRMFYVDNRKRNDVMAWKLTEHVQWSDMELVWIICDIATVVCPLSSYSYFLCECLHSNGHYSGLLCNVKWNVCDNFINVACLENVLEIKCNIWLWHESL